eukprot:TRINITY_DN23904_c0_g1_i1.p1 TRINITY_DN23904_c0_g1~~TRINITY_DN23904_c0_g1_i1.p1  ORF type:complete len:1202 (-),score=289.10 TRINITY_DN23904_c0_g1_i1:89-3694(-)
MAVASTDEGFVDWEGLFRALASREFNAVLSDVRASKSAALLSYAKVWLDCVAQELAAEVADGLHSADRRRPGDESENWLLVVQGLASDGAACVAQIRKPGAAAEESARPVPVLGGDDGEEPPLTYQLLLSTSPAPETLFFISRPHAEVADAFRALPLDPVTLRPARLPDVGARRECVNVGTALSALYRAHSLCSVHKLQPSLRCALIPGYEPSSAEKERARRSPWKQLDFDDGVYSGIILNVGQQKALQAMDGPVAVVQGPPGTGKSSFITEAFLRRVPNGAKVLGCTSTNKAIDSLVSKFEAAGVTEMLVVGSADRVGEASKRYLMPQRLATDKIVAKSEVALAKVTQARELCEEAVTQAKKQRKPKKDADGKEDNRGFVERQLAKLSPTDKKPVRKTPGITRLLNIIGKADATFASNAKLYAACKEHLDKPPDGEDEKAVELLRAANRELRAAEKAEEAAQVEVWRQKRNARGRVWRSARFVACTASSAAQVTRRILRTLVSESDDEDGGKDEAEAAQALSGKDGLLFRAVILDEAGAMLEPDAIGTLLHGAEAVLLVGDHYQLPPFSRWREGREFQYDVSLMERLSRNSVASGGTVMKSVRGGGAMALALPPVTMLEEQYRMHPVISDAVSIAFYGGRLKTPACIVSSRRHPLPFNWVEGGGKETQPEGATSWSNEAEADAASRLVRMFVEWSGHSQDTVNVLTFYNGQRTLIAGKLNKIGMRDVMVASVDSMQGREVDVVILSCVRTGLDRRSLGFLSDWRRANVAISRARECLVVLGCWDTVRQDKYWATALRGAQVFSSGDAAFGREFQRRVMPSGKPSAPELGGSRDVGGGGVGGGGRVDRDDFPALSADRTSDRDGGYGHGDAGTGVPLAAARVEVPTNWEDCVSDVSEEEAAADQDDPLAVAKEAVAVVTARESWDDEEESAPALETEGASPKMRCFSRTSEAPTVLGIAKVTAAVPEEQSQNRGNNAKEADDDGEGHVQQAQDENQMEARDGHDEKYRVQEKRTKGAVEMDGDDDVRHAKKEKKGGAKEKREKKNQKKEEEQEEKERKSDKKEKKDKEEKKEKKEKKDKKAPEQEGKQESGERRVLELFTLAAGNASGGDDLAERLQSRCTLLRPTCVGRPSAQAALLDAVLRRCNDTGGSAWEAPVRMLKVGDVLQAEGAAVWDAEHGASFVTSAAGAAEIRRAVAALFR